jgi:cytochrome c oxidase subunit 3
MQRDLAEPQLTREELQALKNRRAGLAIFQASWIMVFVVLILVNWQLRSQAPSWPPPGVVELDPIIPTLMTIGLAASSLLVRQGTRAVKAGRTAMLRSRWRIAIALGALFVAVMAFEWAAVPYSGQYSNVFRLMVGFHGVHALAIGIFLVHVYRHAEQYSPTHFWPVEAAAGLWHFVTIAWMMFYAVLYVV